MSYSPEQVEAMADNLVGYMNTPAAPMLRAYADTIRQAARVDEESLLATAQAIREHAALFGNEHTRNDMHGFADSIEAALSAQPAEHPAAPVGVPDAPLSVFSKGGWTYSGTGQSFDEKAMDEAAFVAYRDYFAAAPSAPQGEAVALNVRHPNCHQAANAFWNYWLANGETHKRGYYESTWGAINAALRMVGVVPHDYGNAPPPDGSSPRYGGAMRKGDWAIQEPNDGDDA
jgi:hypothetical protein